VNKFDKAFEIIVGEEGGYVNDPHDPGGETKYGISKRVYPNVDIKNLTLDEAKKIYERDYWSRASCGSMPWPMSLYVFDSAVNQGVGRAIRLMQTAVGTNADGVVGPKTLQAIHNAGEEGAVQFMGRRAMAYVATANFDRFGRGWLTRLFRVMVKGKEYGG
jgi:lysozyme family protein